MKDIPDESSVELASRYRRELQDLIDLGEVSPATAQRVLDDMLEPEMPGRRRRVRLPVWLDRRAEAEAEAAKQARWRVLWDRAKQLVERIRGLFR